MKLSEIKAGMEGEGKTIFKGTRIETFTFKVLGLIEKFAPDKNLIIVELKSPFLDNDGIYQGMSGSPAYIDGKLIGAVAYGFSFSKKPIGGITPIEDIIETSDYNTSPFSIDISDIKVEFEKKNLAFIADFVQKELARRMNFSPSAALTPIKLIASHRGFEPSALSYLKPLFALSPVNSLKIRTNKAFGKSPKSLKPSKDLLKITAAGAVSIPLITGDFEIASYGTVTHVDGDKIYLFGHPYFNLGAVDFPLHKAEVITLVPSFQTSFKLMTSRNMVGRVVQDRFSAVQGELGKLPYMIPMKVFLKNMDRTFNLEMVNHPLLTPVLSAVSMINIFSSQYHQFGFHSIKVKGKIFIKGERNIIINDLYSGTNSYGDFGNLLLAINFFLMNNREKNIKIQKMDFEISGSENLRKANIENVLIEKKSFFPGEMIKVAIYLRNEKGEPFTDKYTLKAPTLKAGSVFYLLVADGEEMSRFESKNIRSSYFPMKLNSLIRAINNLRKNNRLYLKLMTPTGGLYVKGHEYSNLPASLQNVFIYDPTPIYGTSTGSQSKIKYSTITEYQTEFPAVIKGKKLFKLKIKERADAQ